MLEAKAGVLLCLLIGELAVKLLGKVLLDEGVDAVAKVLKGNGVV